MLFLGSLWFPSFLGLWCSSIGSIRFLPRPGETSAVAWLCSGTQVFKFVKDAGKVTETELWTMRYCLTECPTKRISLPPLPQFQLDVMSVIDQ